MKHIVVWMAVVLGFAVTEAQTLSSSSFVWFNFGTKVKEFSESEAARSILRSFDAKTMPKLEAGVRALVTKETQLVMLGENHEDGAGSIGYPALLRAMDADFPFDCVFFERDRSKSEDRIQALIDALDARVGNQSMLPDYAAAAEKLIQDRPSLLLGFQGTLVPMEWTATDLAETRILAFMLSRGREIAWHLVDDVSRIKPWVFWDIRHRNEVMAANIAAAFARGNCRKGLAVNGKKHLTGFLEMNEKNTLEISRPLQEILRVDEKLSVVAILLSTGREWGYSGLSTPVGLSHHWKLRPSFNLAVEREVIDASQSSMYAGLSGEKKWPILLEEVPTHSFKSLSSDPDHGKSPSLGLNARMITQHNLMLGNVRSFDAILYVQ